ncbi:MAG: hypothetical protein RLZ98_2424 [Pseudomonadota bacterium]|jgi:tripartite-type tricarboxylate transporter receptor subunit TctC
MTFLIPSRQSARAALAVGSLLLVGGIAPPAQAEDFYKGKTLRILIGHPPGGSFDGYAQLAAAHYDRHIPGKPNVIVEHRPGGGGRVAGNYLFSKAPTDGTMIALLPDTMVHSQILEPKRSRWDMRKANYIGRMSTSHTVFGVRKDTGVKDVKGLMTTELKAGCTGKTSPSAQMPLLVKNLDGAKFQIVCGYRGSGPYMLALQRGEVNMVAMNWGTWEAKLLDEVKAGNFIMIMQIGQSRNKLIPDVPTLQEVIGDTRSKTIYNWVGISSDIGRALFGAPGVPAAQIKTLRTAFDGMAADPVFQADVKKRGFPLDVLDGASVDKMKDDVLSIDPKLAAIADKAMADGYREACLNCGGKAK